MLTAERLREVLHYDPKTGIFTWLCSTGRSPAGRIAARTGQRGYLTIGIDGRRHYAHRLAWLYMTGEHPKAQIDHVDLDRSNNRWSNLREATNSQNNMNVRHRRGNVSRYKGVTAHRKGRWVARIQVNGKQAYLGYFDDPEAAHAAYCEAATRLHGEFARAA